VVNCNLPLVLVSFKKAIRCDMISFTILQQKNCEKNKKNNIQYHFEFLQIEKMPIVTLDSMKKSQKKASARAEDSDEEDGGGNEYYTGGTGQGGKLLLL